VFTTQILQDGKSLRQLDITVDEVWQLNNAQRKFTKYTEQKDFEVTYIREIKSMSKFLVQPYF
jgi:hypothetical protein